MNSINDLHVNASMLSLLRAGCVISTGNFEDSTRLYVAALYGHKGICVKKKWGYKRFAFSKEGLGEAIEYAMDGSPS